MPQMIVKALMGLRWWVLLCLAGSVFLGGVLMKSHVEKLSTLWETPVPEAVVLGKFDRGRDIHTANEVNVIAWIGSKRPQRLIDQQDAQRHIHFLYGSPMEKRFGTVRAAVVLRADEREPFAELYPTWSPSRAMPGGAIEINGTATRSHRLKDDVFALMREQGLEPAPEFIFVRPFFLGRHYGLSAPEGYIFAADLTAPFAAMLLILSVVKLVMELTGFAGRETRAEKPHLPSAGALVQGFGRQIFSALFGLVLIAIFYVGAMGLASDFEGGGDTVITLFFLLIVGVGFWWEAGHKKSLMALLRGGAAITPARQMRDWPSDERPVSSPRAEPSGGVSMRDLSQLSGSPLVKSYDRPRLFTSQGRKPRN
ncbi:MAG: hypothetical protein N4A70_01710 [Pelagimonas sp.]|jgi:hypothetical protein|nr:hypothetical protein [Pelagimonas sp.]